jgi:[ribosomal protein S18]-alanine N-acetyltransferase
MSNLLPRIRRYHPEDFETLFRIDQICFPTGIAFSRGELAFFLRHPKSIARVAEGSGRILGFVLARLENQNSAHVLTLDVVPEFRKHNIGTALMNRLHRELEKQKVGTSILEVGVQNIAAQRLYKKLNYHYQGTLVGYYRGREDAYLMIRVDSRQSSVISNSK